MLNCSSRKRWLQRRVKKNLFGDLLVSDVVQEIETLLGRQAVEELDLEALELAVRQQALQLAGAAVEQRLIGGRAGDERPLPTVDLIREKLFELAGELKDEVMDALAAELLTQNKPAGPTQANRAARERMGPLWDTL